MHSRMYKNGDHSGFLIEKNERIQVFYNRGYKLWFTHKIEYYAAL